MLSETDFEGGESPPLKKTVVDLTAPFNPAKATLFRFASSVLMLATVILYCAAVPGKEWVLPLNGVAGQYPSCHVGLFDSCGCNDATRNRGECLRMEKKTRFGNPNDEAGDDMDFARYSPNIAVSQGFGIVAMVMSIISLCWSIWTRFVSLSIWTRFVSLSVSDTYKLFLGIESVVWFDIIVAVCGLVAYFSWEETEDFVMRRAENDVALGKDAKNFFIGTIFACVATVVAYLEVNPAAEMSDENPHKTRTFTKPLSNLLTVQPGTNTCEYVTYHNPMQDANITFLVSPTGQENGATRSLSKVETLKSDAGEKQRYSTYSHKMHVYSKMSSILTRYNEIASVTPTSSLVHKKEGMGAASEFCSSLLRPQPRMKRGFGGPHKKNGTKFV
eukprot:g36697.t1